MIAEDQAMLQAGLVSLLEASGHEVAAAVGDGAALRAVFGDWDADIAIVDIRLPPTHTDEGLRAVLDARKNAPGLPVLLFSQYVERLYVRELLTDRVGAVGYLLKDRVAHPRQFMDALAQVAAGGTVLDPTVIDTMLTRADAQRPLDTLTTRERDVLRLIAEGRSNAAIGTLLHLSDSATTKHITHIFDKLGLPPSPDDNRRVLAVLTYLDA